MILTIATLVVGLGLAEPATAQSSNMYIGGLLGIGGSLDGQLDDGFNDLAYQLEYGLFVERKGLVVVRAGQMSVAGSPDLEGDLTYVNIAGEYRFFDRWYDSGVYAGLGWYGVGLDNANAGFLDDEGIGVVVGVTGDFSINEDWSVLVEFAGHWLDTELVRFAAAAHVGVAWKF